MSDVRASVGWVFVEAQASNIARYIGLEFHADFDGLRVIAGIGGREGVIPDRAWTDTRCDVECVGDRRTEVDAVIRRADANIGGPFCGGVGVTPVFATSRAPPSRTAVGGYFNDAHDSAHIAGYTGDGY